MAYMAEYNFLRLKFFEVDIFSDFCKNVLIQFRQEFDFLFFLNSQKFTDRNAPIIRHSLIVLDPGDFFTILIILGPISFHQKTKTNLCWGLPTHACQCLPYVRKFLLFDFGKFFSVSTKFL